MAAPANTGLMPAGLQDTLMQTVELRTMNTLLFTLLADNQAADELRALRNDQAFELGLTPPVIAGN